jgi:hypothetical protein
VLLERSQPLFRFPYREVYADAAPLSSLQHILGWHVHSFRVGVAEWRTVTDSDVKLLPCRNDVLTGAMIGSEETRNCKRAPGVYRV